MVRTPMGDIERELRDPEYARLFGEASAKSEFAILLSRARDRAGATQKELADRLGVSQAYIGKLSAGDANPTLGAVGRMLAALGFELRMDIEPLLGYDENGKLASMPVDLEEPLLKHPKVENVAIMGISNKSLGEKTCAYIKPKAGQTITLEEVTSFLSAQGITAYDLPECVEIVDVLPVTDNEIDKKSLGVDIAYELKKQRKI